METHRQQCQACRSYTLRNILVREEGRPTTVYVRCAECGELVARYELSAYYHHGKGIDSYLRSVGPRGATESGRKMLSEFKRVQDDAAGGFRRALETLEETGKNY